MLGLKSDQARSNHPISKLDVVGYSVGCRLEKLQIKK